MAAVWTEENARRESINAWTHGFGFLLSIPAGWMLCTQSLHSPDHLIWACIVYSFSLSAMYFFSTLSHAIRDPTKRPLVRALDQGVIYTLIAGTFTPFAWGKMEGWPRVLFLAAVWGAAILGFYSKVLAKHRVDNMASVSYVLLGWLPAMVLLAYVSLPCFAFMAFGGVLYTVGTLFLQNDHRSRYFHAIWHLLVILASACHFAAILIFVVN